MVRVRFFAGLAEQVGLRETGVELDRPVDVGGLWDRVAGMERPARLRCARNLVHCHLDDPVQDGDEVAFFPPVTGG